MLALIGIGNDERAIATALAEMAGGHIELLALESLERRMPVEVTLRSRKVYVGYVWSVAVGTACTGDLTLLPILSGYREEETLDSILYLDYAPVVQAFTNPESTLDEDDFRVVIRMTEIISARLFEESVYDAFQAQMEYD